jgi:hypothetical protein
MGEVRQAGIALVDRGGYECVDLTIFEALGGHHKGADGVFAAYLRKRTGLEGYFFVPAGEDIDLGFVELVKVPSDGEGEGRIGDAFAGRIHEFLRSKYDGRAELGHARVRESLDNDLRANAIYVAYGDANPWFVGHVVKVVGEFYLGQDKLCAKLFSKGLASHIINYQFAILRKPSADFNEGMKKDPVLVEECCDSLGAFPEGFQVHLE